MDRTEIARKYQERQWQRKQHILRRNASVLAAVSSSKASMAHTTSGASDTKGNKMNANVKKLWVDALRSGTYEQGKGALCKGGQYCCLGVLCELAVQAGVIPPGERLETETGPSHYICYDRGHVYANNELPSFGDTAFLPQCVQEWAGLPRTSGAIVVIDGADRPLAAQNDCGKTFEQIAQAIEEQL
jgi:hypothetical protein